MTDQKPEVTVPVPEEGKQILATGHIEGSKIEVSVSRGLAVLTLKFDANEELDEYGLGSVDYLISGLPEAASQVMDAINAKIDEVTGE